MSLDCPFDDSDPAAEAPKHLTELEPDVAAADTIRCSGKKSTSIIVDVWSGRGTFFEPRHLGNQWPPADVDEDLVGHAQLVAYADGMGTGKRACPR